MIRRPPRSTLFPYPPLSRSAARRPRSEPPPSPAASATAYPRRRRSSRAVPASDRPRLRRPRSEEHTSELQSRQYLVCRLLLEKKKKRNKYTQTLHINTVSRD